MKTKRKESRSPINATSRHSRISPRVQALLDQVEAVRRDQTLDHDERNRELRRLSNQILGLPEVSSLVWEAFRRIDDDITLSWNIRESVIARLGDAVIQLPEAGTSPQRLRGLTKRVTRWVLADEARSARDPEGVPQMDHPRNAISLDGSVRRRADGEDTQPLAEVISGPTAVDVAHEVEQRDRLARILELACERGPAINRTIRMVAEGYSYREIAQVEGTTENAIAKRVEQFRKYLERLDV